MYGKRKIVNGKLLQLLALRANVCAAANNFELDDGGAAARAWLAVAAKNVGKGQVASSLPLSIDIVAVGAATLFDTEPEYASQGFV